MGCSPHITTLVFSAIYFFSGLAVESCEPPLFATNGTLYYWNYYAQYLIAQLLQWKGCGLDYRGRSTELSVLQIFQASCGTRPVGTSGCSPGLKWPGPELSSIYEGWSENNAPYFFLGRYLFLDLDNNTQRRVTVWLHSLLFHKVSVRFYGTSVCMPCRYHALFCSRSQIFTAWIRQLTFSNFVLQIASFRAQNSWNSEGGRGPTGGWGNTVQPVMASRVFRLVCSLALSRCSKKEDMAHSFWAAYAVP